MSTFVLSIIVYNFQNCGGNSRIFSIDSAYEIVSWYSVTVLVLICGFSAVYAASYCRKESHKNKVFAFLRGCAWIVGITGCIIGLVTDIEMIQNENITIFSAFDIYSFFISLSAVLATYFYKIKHAINERISPI